MERTSTPPEETRTATIQLSEVLTEMIKTEEEKLLRLCHLYESNKRQWTHIYKKSKENPELDIDYVKMTMILKQERRKIIGAASYLRASITSARVQLMEIAV